MLMYLLLSFLILSPVRGSLLGSKSNLVTLELNSQSAKSELSFTNDETQILELIGSVIGLSVGELTSMFSLAKVGLGVIEILDKIFTKVFNTTSIDFSIFDRPGLDRQILSMFEIVTLRLEQIQKGIQGTQSGLRDLVRDLPNMVRWEIALDTLDKYIRNINNLHHRFAVYQIHKMDVENMTLLNFASAVVSHEATSTHSQMANIHSMISPSDPPQLTSRRSYGRNEYDVTNRVTSDMSNDFRRIMASRDLHLSKRLAKIRMQEISMRPSIFTMLEDAIDSYGTCNQKQSPQQLIFGLYTLIAVTQARGYAMSNFGYNLLQYHNKGTFDVERQLSKDLYMHYSTALFRIGRHALEKASTSFRKCDPLEHKEGSTYVQMTELLQGYIENEVDLNRDGTCKNSCDSYQLVKVHGCFLPEQQYCGKHRRCKGTVHNCKFLDSDAKVCLGSKPHRRYDWIHYEKNKVILGQQNGDCENPKTVNSWWRWFYHCSYCMCLCDDPSSPYTDRFISLRPAVSDIDANMIVTGIRFVKKNRFIQMEIKEGLAIAQGEVNVETLKWREAETISVESPKFEDGVDYFTMKFEARNLDLDRLKAPKGHVVTGVKFRMLGQHVNLQMWVTPINFTSGILSPNMSFWKSNENTPINMNNPRKELFLYEPESPANNLLGSEEVSRPDTFVKFQPTSLRADVSQLTVPFFDAQPVVPSPSTWLEGIEIYHRGSRGFGGFIGLQVFNYNLSRHLNDENEENLTFLN